MWLFSPNAVLAHTEDVSDKLQASSDDEFLSHFFSFGGSGAFQNGDALAISTDHDCLDHGLFPLLLTVRTHYSTSTGSVNKKVSMMLFLHNIMLSVSAVYG